MKDGVLSELVALGANKAYPNFSVLTKSEDNKTLANKWNVCRITKKEK